MFKSIKTRLLIWLITSFAVTMTVLGFFLFNRLDIIVMDMVDHLLSDKSEILEGLVHAEKGEIEFEISDITAGDYAIINSGHYFEITDDKGNSLVKSKSLGTAGFTSLKKDFHKTGFYMETGPAREPVRLFIRSFRPVGGETLFVFLAEEIRAELHLLSSFKVFLMFILPMTVLISAIGSIIIIRLSLKPLSSFSKQIGRITEKRLHERVDSIGVDAELKELAASFNETMERLEKAFDAQRDFLSNASHELRTPTTVIRASAQLALRKERPVEEYREALETVKSAAERMGGLIDRLLKLSRLDADVAGVNKGSLSLRDLLQTAVKAATPLAEDREVRVYLEESEDITVEGDKDQLLELFLCIIDNAVKYNKPDGMVNLSMAVSDGWAITRITDAGIGISPENLDKIFDRFYRADMSRGEIPGTGLGLPIAKGIAESHGGRIEVESKVGKGTTFFVYLPTSDVT